MSVIAKSLGRVPLLSECSPGVDVVEFNVVIAPEEFPDKLGKLFIPEAAKEKIDSAAMRGRLVAASPLAFSYAEWPNGARMPQVGDVVIFAKYAGVLFDGADGREYRACKDKDIILVATAAAE